jgi:Fe-S cluster assembly iron-binding protein IscA
MFLLTEQVHIDKNNDNRQLKDVNIVPGISLAYSQKIMEHIITFDNPKNTQFLRQCARSK